MFGHQRLTLSGTNWVIRPIFVDRLAAKMVDAERQNVENYIAERHPDFAPNAYADLLGLAEYVRKALAGKVQG
jgi:hypothetical protein